MKFYKHLTIIGVDHGYGNIKTANHIFKSGVIKCNEKPYFDKNLLTYNGEYYLIGEGHKEFVADKFIDFDYYVLTLAAIATELRQRGTTQAVVHIAAGLPLTWIGQQMESFKEYLLQNKTVDFKFKGVDYHITIAGADVFPQGYSAIASRVSEFSGMNMLADIGNGTMNIMNINNGNPDIQNWFTEKFGTYQCTLKIKENMMKKHHANIDEDIITEFLCTGTADVLEDYLVTMRETAKEYVSEIFRRLREHNYNPNLMKLHIVGGGGCLVKNFTNFEKNRVYINDDICATAKGYEYLADLILRSRGDNK